MEDLFGREWLETEFENKKDLVNFEWLQLEDGIVINEKRYLCNRCLNDQYDLFGAFVYEQKEVIYCRDCINFGMVSQNTKLYRSTKKHTIQKTAHELNADFKLSKLQQVASSAALKALENQTKLMIWAVCGAGKTEMMFETISQALKEKKRVCWAIPRSDVVIELAPRLQKAFPQASVVALHGNSEQKNVYGDIVVSTTHQLIRFFKAFELLIVDEVDAFPYTFDAMLPRVVQKACTENCATIYLSATPSQHDIKKIKKGELPCCVIPARYHMYPLDVPKYKYCGDYKWYFKKGKLPPSFKRWIENKKTTGRRALLFVPSIQTGTRLCEILKKQGYSVEFVSSPDEARTLKVQTFKEQGYQFLVTTMILERGVTIVDIDVAIIGANEEVFEESALVQISGRVGRHPKFPSGEIMFFHNGLTLQMDRAVTQIKQMNEKARNLRLLKELR